MIESPDFKINRKEVENLTRLNFVYIEGGRLIVGSNDPLKGGVEGYRHNEVPKRKMEVKPFWLCKYKITNTVFEYIFPNHHRSYHSLLNTHPVVDVTYNEVTEFIRKINLRLGMEFRLPTELEWTFAAAPIGWEYPHGDKPDLSAGHVFGDGYEFGCSPIGDSRWRLNWKGLDQMGYNVSEMTSGTYSIPGNFGAESDGMYCIVKGGNWGKCKLSPNIHRRRIFDIIDRNPRVGFRLAYGKL